MTQQELLAEIERLKTANAALIAKSKRVNKITFKVSEKGAVSAYGMGRFPVTLYYEQWLRLADVTEELRAFLEANKSVLRMKADNAA